MHYAYVVCRVRVRVPRRSGKKTQQWRPEMEALYLLIPISVILVFAAIWFFFSMSDSGQFDDMEGPALRILQDDDNAKE